MKGKTKKGIVRDGFYSDLPETLQFKIMDVSKIVAKAVDDALSDPAYKDLKDSSWAMSCIDEFRSSPTTTGDIGAVRVTKKGNKFEAMIQITGHFRNHQYGWIEELLHDFIRDVYQTARTIIRKKYDMRLVDEGSLGSPEEGFDVYTSSKLAKEIWDLFEDKKDKTITENSLFEYLDHIDDIELLIESSNNIPEYNTDMTEAQAKKTLRTLSQSLINDFANNKKMTQYTANIYANIITKNLLPRWANGYKKLTITLDNYQSFPTLEFKVPTMTQDFISRYINGREPIDAFLHRIPEIKIKMSPRIFHTMKDPDDAFNFFKAAIKYYDSGIAKYSKSLMIDAMKLDHNMKHLVSTTKLSGIITYPMMLLFVFDDVDMTNKDSFKIDQNDIKTVNQFFKNIYINYASPEKEKKKILEDVKDMIKVLKESCKYDDNIKTLSYLPESVDDLLSGKFDEQIQIADDKFIREQVDFDDMRNQKDPKVTYLQEAFGVKKLKKIPTDLVAYITIETEAIKDANDKMMIASYTLGKIEIVEWYIELLEVGSKKYIVPHTKPYLESVRTQLLACFKKIMDTPIPKSKDRPLIDIKYPKGYEG